MVQSADLNDELFYSDIGILTCIFARGESPLNNYNVLKYIKITPENKQHLKM